MVCSSLVPMTVNNNTNVHMMHCMDSLRYYISVLTHWQWHLLSLSRSLSISISLSFSLSPPLSLSLSVEDRGTGVWCTLNLFITDHIETIDPRIVLPSHWHATPAHHHHRSFSLNECLKWKKFIIDHTWIHLKFIIDHTAVRAGSPFEFNIYTCQGGDRTDHNNGFDYGRPMNVRCWDLRG